FNAITYWSLNPFPSLVRVPEFPDIALDDVWRTTVKFEHSYEYNGKNLVSPELLQEHEVVKKMTIDEKISFWKKVMEYASNRGIEVYFFTWNIFINGEFGKYGITESRSNDTTIAYYRASVREMVLTYPHLAGIGITAGENMGGKDEKYTNEQWLWKTYGEGISDALAIQPGRNVRLIHRFHMTGLADIRNNFKDYPGILDLSIKYSIAHMYSIPNPPFAKGAFEILPENMRTWLTVRNDDIYSFRWGNPDYARQYLKEIPGPEKVAGYYMGSDGYCLGRDFLGKDNVQPRPLLIQKQWYSYMIWGRLSYNPELPDELFRQTLEERFQETEAETLMDAWSASSMVFPWATRLIWGDIDVKWLPEACISSPVYKGFYTVRDVMEVDPMPGSNIQNITDWAQNYKLNKPAKLMSPLAAADSLSKYSRLAMISLRQLPARDPGSFEELNQTLGDIEAFATIGFYYSEKIRAACSLALFNFYGLEQDKTEAMEHLTKARDYWIRYAELYDSKYKPALYNRVGYVDIPSLIEKTEKDIEIARDWKPGDIKEYTPKTSTESSFRK
ncbi:MAG: carbohydrate-binding family 6 protein, partial [Bacteroidales bacterium]|nr:carbohydrate-binding family 6 protein [Bacteroidales bacterium]